MEHVLQHSICLKNFVTKKNNFWNFFKSRGRERSSFFYKIKRFKTISSQQIFDILKYILIDIDSKISLQIKKKLTTELYHFHVSVG